VSQTTVLAQLLGLAGVKIDLAEREADGSWTVHTTTAAGRRGRDCPDCGRVAHRVKEPTTHTVKHVALVPMRLTWHKSRFWCENTECDKASLAETGPMAGSRAGVSTHATTVMGHLVGDWLAPVSRVAAGVGVAWHTAHAAFVAVAGRAQIEVTDTTTSGATNSGAGDAEPGRPDREAAHGGDPVLAGADRAPASADPLTRPSRSASGVLPPVAVLGIDDHRRGKPLYHRDPTTGAWVADANRWQTWTPPAGTGCWARSRAAPGWTPRRGWPPGTRPGAPASPTSRSTCPASISRWSPPAGYYRAPP